MFKLDVRADVREVERMLTDVQREVVPQATATALNKTINKVRTLSVRELSSRLKIPQKVLKKRLIIPRSAKASPRRLTASVIGLLLDVRLSDVSPGRQTKAGVTVRGEAYKGAFRAKLPSGQDGVWRRSESAHLSSGRDSKGRPRKNRLPIEAVKFRINPPAEQVVEKNIRASDEYWRKTLEHEINYRLTRKGYR